MSVFLSVNLDVSPMYTSLSEDIPMFDIHLAVAVEAEKYSVRIRRDVLSEDNKNTSEVEATPSSSYRETVPVTKQPPLSAATATPTTKSHDFATTSASVSTTTIKTSIKNVSTDFLFIIIIQYLQQMNEVFIHKMLFSVPDRLS